MNRLLIVIIAAVLFVTLACDTGNGGNGCTTTSDLNHHGSSYCQP